MVVVNANTIHDRRDGWICTFSIPAVVDKLDHRNFNFNAGTFF